MPIESLIPNAAPLPVPLRDFDTNRDYHLNPPELTDDLVDATFALSEDNIKLLFHNSTLVMPVLYTKIAAANRPEAQKLRVLHILDERTAWMARQRTQIVNPDVLWFGLSSLHMEVAAIRFTWLRGTFAYVTEPEDLEPHAYTKQVREIANGIETYFPEDLAESFGIPADVIRAIQPRIGVFFVNHKEELVHSTHIDNERGFVTIGMNNALWAQTGSMIELLHHEYAHAILPFFIGDTDDLPVWMSEGLATFAQGSLGTERQVHTVFCTNADVSVTKRCNLRTRADVTADEKHLIDVIEGMLKQRTCLRQPAPSQQCLPAGDTARMSWYGGSAYRRAETHINPYMFYGAAFLWLGRGQVHSLIAKLHAGIDYRTAVTDVVAARVGKPVANYGEALRILDEQAFRTVMYTLEPYIPDLPIPHSSVQ